MTSTLRRHLFRMIAAAFVAFVLLRLLSNSMELVGVDKIPWRWSIDFVSTLVGIAVFVYVLIRMPKQSLSWMLVVTVAILLVLARAIDFFRDAASAHEYLGINGLDWLRRLTGMVVEPARGLVVAVFVWLLVESSRQEHKLRHRLKWRERLSQRSQDRLRRYQALVEHMPNFCFMFDRQGRIIEWNSAATRLYGYSREEALGRSAIDFVVSDRDRPISRTLMSEVLGGKSYMDFSWRDHNRSGTEGIRIGNIFPMRLGDGTIECGVCMGIDATHDIENRRKLATQRRHLEQLISAHERDRQLVAFDIHDGVIQGLSAALMHIETATLEPNRLNETAAFNCGKAIDLLRSAVEECRRVLTGLRPPVLDERGVVEAIEGLLAEQRKRGGPTIAFQHDLRLRRLSPLLEGALFRITQEAVSNVVRHSSADVASIVLRQTGDRLLLEIHDSGCGFDPSLVDEQRLGLKGIRARAEAVHGSARVESSPAAGTRIVVDLPMLDSLEREAARRMQAEEKLQEAYARMELQVEERTAELALANEQLRNEIAERNRFAQRTTELAAVKEQLELEVHERQRNRSFIDRVGEAAPILLFVFDAMNLRLVYVNGYVQRTMGYDANQPLDMRDERVDRLIHPEDRPHFAEFLERVTRSTNDEPIPHEVRVQHSNGQWRRLRGNVVVFERNQAGSPRWAVGAAEILPCDDEADPANAHAAHNGAPTEAAA